MNSNEIEVIEFQPAGYKPLHDYGEWRVAVLRYCDDLRIENIKTMQKHNETDEIFVLLNGSCTLFSAGNGDAPGVIHSINLQPHKLYNVKRGVWHNHIMNPSGEVLIVENRTTSDDNSPIMKLNDNQLDELQQSHCNIRELTKEEYPLLNDFLYDAIYQRDGEVLAPKSIIERPELLVYIKDFGTLKDDYCLCAQINEEVVGAVWVRNIKGYGSIDDTTPEFAISVRKEFRGQGIGTKLMNEMIKSLKAKGYLLASLAVQKDNYAVNMYQKVGFQIIDENEQEFIMICNIASK